MPSYSVSTVTINKATNTLTFNVTVIGPGTFVFPQPIVFGIVNTNNSNTFVNVTSGMSASSTNYTGLTINTVTSGVYLINLSASNLNTNIGGGPKLITITYSDMSAFNTVPNNSTDLYKAYIGASGTFSDPINTTPGIQESPLSAFCLFEDTEVLTPSGYVSVKTLQDGDFVTTSDGRTSKIIQIWSSKMPFEEKFYPLVIPENSIAENYPPKDCRMTKGHLIQYNDKWIVPYKNKHIFYFDNNLNSLDSLNYYHIQLENYLTDHLVINGGLIVESFGNMTEDAKLEWRRRSNESIIL